MKVIVLVDGEHYPPVVRDAIASLQVGGTDVVGAVFCGGTEKVDIEALDLAYGIHVVKGETPAAALVEALDRFKPEAILDMTDEPVLHPADRMLLASIALRRGVRFGGADFEFRPPILEDVLTKPSISVFATGKRTGKTALASALARHATSRGHTPIIVAVGRGGPNPPRVIDAGTVLDPAALLALVEAGQHASSDYVEDALTSGVTTIGCRRVGGGLAGATITSNMSQGARMANDIEGDLVILEGSGASIPEVRAHANVLVVPASIGDEVSAFLNPYRLLLADLAVVTMAEKAPQAAATEAAILGTAPDLDVVSVVFRPEPLADVRGRHAFFCTTAPASAATVLREHLQATHGCHVVGISHHLADRAALRADLEKAPKHDVMLVELKAAAVDVVVRSAANAGTDVVFVNNAVVGRGVEAAFDAICERASTG